LLEGGGGETALVVLNAPLPRDDAEDDNGGGRARSVFLRLWSQSSYRVCADGGANRLRRYARRIQRRRRATDSATVGPDESQDRQDDEGFFIPDLVVGDLDSIRPAVRRYYEQERGCRVRRVPDQDRNDLDKALEAVRDEHTRRRWKAVATSRCGAGDGGAPPPFRNVVVYGAFGGRFDQEMASFQALYAWGRAFDENGGSGEGGGGVHSAAGHETTLWLYSDATCACLLRPPPGGDPMAVENRVALSSAESPDSVGLIPLGGRCDRVSTRGLRWNLDGETPLEFGGLVSTSNRIVSPDLSARVWTTHPLVFTARVLLVPGAATKSEWDEEDLDGSDEEGDDS
jgi:thiamine pyrophosphokinase